MRIDGGYNSDDGEGDEDISSDVRKRKLQATDRWDGRIMKMSWSNDGDVSSESEIDR